MAYYHKQTIKALAAGRNTDREDRKAAKERFDEVLRQMKEDNPRLNISEPKKTDGRRKGLAQKILDPPSEWERFRRHINYLTDPETE